MGVQNNCVYYIYFIFSGNFNILLIMSATFKLSCSSKINIMFPEFNTPGSLQMMLVDGPLPWSPNKEKSLQVVYLYWAFFFSGVFKAHVLCHFLWSWMILLSCSKFVPKNSFSSTFLVKLLVPLPIGSPSVCVCYGADKDMKILRNVELYYSHT